MRFPSIEHIAFYEYWPWNQDEIYKILYSEAGWVKPTDVASDWHYDCIFNVFKEYSFQNLLGVSYTDGFLSNQIRAGLISRNDAKKKLMKSKQYFQKTLSNSLEKVGLTHMRSLIDESCFSKIEN